MQPRWSHWKVSSKRGQSLFKLTWGDMLQHDAETEQRHKRALLIRTIATWAYTDGPMLAMCIGPETIQTQYVLSYLYETISYKKNWPQKWAEGLVSLSHVAVAYTLFIPMLNVDWIQKHFIALLCHFIFKCFLYTKKKKPHTLISNKTKKEKKAFKGLLGEGGKACANQHLIVIL